MEEQGKVCKKCGVWKPLDEYNKHKLGKCGRQSKCKECEKEYRKQHYQNNKEYYKELCKQYRENNKEHCKEINKQYRENNKEHYKELNKQWKENNKDKIKEYNKRYRENNKGQSEEYHKRYREANKDKIKQWKENNKEHVKEYNKIYRKEWDKNNRNKEKENNLIKIANLLEQINPVFKQLNLPVYGYIYMFENIKTRRKYLGQSILPLKHRYKSNIIQGWIKERLGKGTQKFKEELIETDIKVTEVLDVACCQYHLDKLEVYYIDKYDSYNNGYNNNAGYHITDDGIEEFEQILKNNGLQFIDGKLVKIA